MTKSLYKIVLILFVVAGTLSATDYIHYRLGKKYKEQGEYQLAREELLKVISVYPDHYNAYYLLGELSRISQDWTAAERYYQNALAYNPGWRTVQKQLAKVYEAQGLNDKAIQMLQQAQRGATDAEKVEITEELNRLAGRVEDTAQATIDSIQNEKRTAEKKARQQKRVVSKSPSAAARGELDKAIRSYKEVVRNGGNNFNTAITHIRKALALHPGYPAAYYYGGLIRRRLNEPEKAIVNFKNAVSDPDMGYNAHFYLGKIYGEQEQYEEAIKQYELYRSKTEYEPGRRDALTMIQQYQDILQKRAADTIDIVAAGEEEVTEELKEIPQKFDVSELMVRIDSFLVMVIADTVTNEGQAMLKAVSLFRESRYDDAVTEFRKVLEKYPSGKVAAMSVYNLGVTAMKLSDWKGAVDKFSQYLERFPDKDQAPSALFLQGVATFEMHDYDLSERLFRSYIQGNRNGVWVGKSYEKIGDIYRVRDELKKAVDAYDLAVKNAKNTEDSIFAMYRKAETLKDLKNWGAALKTYKSIIKTGEENSVYIRIPDSHYRIADHLYETGNYAEARDEYLRVTRLYPTYKDTPWGFFQLGNIAKNLGEFERSIAAYDTLIARYPEDYWAPHAEWKRKDAQWQNQYGTDN